MIYLDEGGLGKPSWMRKITLKNAAKAAFAPHTLLLNKKQNGKIFKVAKTAFAPHTLLTDRRKKPRIQPQAVGLGKLNVKKALKKVKLKTVIKQVGKVAKIAAPLVAGMIPVGGGVASGIVGKVVNSKIGKGAIKLSKTKVGSAVLSQAGVTMPEFETIPAPTTTAKAIPVKKKKGLFSKKAKAKPVAKPVAKTATIIKPAATKAKPSIKLKKKKTAKTLAIGSKGEEVKELQEQLGVEPDGDFGPKTEQALQQATGQKTINTEVLQAEPMYEEEPQGEITPIKPFAATMGSEQPMASTGGFATPPKNNTMLYVGGAAVLLGAVYLATKSKGSN